MAQERKFASCMELSKMHTGLHMANKLLTVLRTCTTAYVQSQYRTAFSQRQGWAVLKKWIVPY